MKISKLYFGGKPKSEVKPIVNTEETIEPAELTPAEQETELLDSILCADCGVANRQSMQSFLCAECDTIRKKGAIHIVPPKPMVEELENKVIDGITDIRRLQFAPASVRYAGKELDQIAFAMLPALPDELKLQIRQLVVRDARAFVSQEIIPTIQDMDVVAEYHHQMSIIIRSLSAKQKDKIILQAKPEFKRLEKERKDKEKDVKIQKSIPNDTISKHTANIVLKGIAEIIAPLDKKQQTVLKDFLDYISLEAQVVDSIDATWLAGLLNRPKYSSLKQYIKVKSA